MWEVERCANCGCADTDHEPVRVDCTAECEREDSRCDGWHEHDSDIECSCGCTKFTMLDDQFEIVCICGCAVDDHDPVDRHDCDAEDCDAEDCDAEDCVTEVWRAKDWDPEDWDAVAGRPIWRGLAEFSAEGPGVECPCGECFVLHEFGTAGERAMAMYEARQAHK